MSSPTLVSTWSETSMVHIWDITKHALLLDSPTTGVAASKGYHDSPLFTFAGHKVTVLFYD